MAKFTDTEGRDWLIEINVATVKRLRAALPGVDLVDPAEDLFRRLATDPVLLADALYVICRVQVEERGLTDEDFGAALAGDAIEAATEAFLAALVDFIPSPQRRTLVAKAWAKVRDLEALGIHRMTELLDSGHLEAEAEAAIREMTTSLLTKKTKKTKKTKTETAGENFTRSPEPSEPTQAA